FGVEVPFDVAGGQESRLVAKEPSGDRGGARGRCRGLTERVGQPAQSARTQLEHLDEMVVLDAKRAGRVDLARLGHLLLFLRRETADLRLEVALLDSRRAQGCIQTLADLIRALCNP